MPDIAAFELVGVAIRLDRLLQGLANVRDALVAGIDEDLLVGAARAGRALRRIRGRSFCQTARQELQHVDRRGGLARFDQRLRIEPPVRASFGSRRLIASASPAISSYSLQSRSCPTRRFASSSSSSLLNPRSAASTLRARLRSSSWASASLMRYAHSCSISRSARPKSGWRRYLRDRVPPGARVLHCDVLDDPQRARSGNSHCRAPDRSRRPDRADRRG